jgi:large subunit ribosomal protein L23
MNVLLTRIDSPHITEKSTRLKEATNTLCFRVNKDSSKVDVRNAVEKLFGVKVASVRMVRVKGKPKRMGRFEGRSSSWKKAYVRLKPGEKTIEYFEGV